VAPKKSAAANQPLASKIAIWAMKHNLSEDAYVSRLIPSVENGSGLDYWASYDATEMLPYPEIKSGLRANSISERLITFRNIMVFVPVAFTWAGISQATTAFSSYSESNPNKIVNFFDFWENGYGVLNKFWTLSNIARIDFLLLTLVIIASMVIAYFQQTSKVLRNAEKSEIDQERLHIAFEVNEYLFRFKALTPVILNQNISAAIRDLRASSSSAGKLMKSSEKSAAELAKGSAIRQQLSSIEKLVEKFQK
jgi:hypothetical protein